VEELIGQSFGKYKIFGHLGTGGMARVFKAYQSTLDRYVALKVMHNYLAEDEEFVARFRQEATAVARLRHSHIIKVHDFDIVNNRFYYMVMEYVDGPTLKEELATRLIMDSPFTLSEVLQVMMSLADAVDYAHARGMIHRDIKPANIMFTNDGHVILTDFGIVRMVGATYNTSTGFLAGTPAYISPEQGRGERGQHHSDIYALGIVLFELLAGKPPFESETPLGLIKQHVEIPPPPIHNFNPDLPIEVEHVLQKALAKEPQDRYQSGYEFVKALQHACDIPTEIIHKLPPINTIALPVETGDPSNPITPVLTSLKTAVSTSPYRGLFAFGEEDSPYFFGREAFTEQLIDAVQNQSMVAVIGPSGSGKSSVVHAGLLPNLRQQPNWTIAVMRPGSDPFQSLAAACVGQLEPSISQTQQLTRTGELAKSLRDESIHFPEIVNKIIQENSQTIVGQQRFLLVVDQFEEIYTLCQDRDLRRQFLDELLDLVDIQRFWLESTFTLVLTLRTDFLGRALRYRPFADALQGTDIKLGPMNRRELSSAIASPANRNGLGFETGLVGRILEDVGDEPGNLPLLEFALHSLWENRESERLSHTAYENIGEVEGALARYADSIYELMSQPEKNSARQIFIQMVRPGSGTEDTRRLATRDELGEANWKLVRQLADAPTRCDQPQCTWTRNG
jgi:serine/threonine protein kinase